MILFITRKYLPTIGGMEKVAYELSTHLANMTEVKLVKWGGSKHRWIPLVLPYLLIRSSWVLLTRKIDIIYVEDGMLAPIGFMLKIFRKPVAVTVHGKDIAFENWVYQLIIPKCINKLDKVFCVSQAIKNACLERGIAENKTIIMVNGISDEFKIDQDRSILKEELSQLVGKNLKNKKVLLSVGRLTMKKGIHWCVDNVIPRLLKHNFVYIIAGDGILSSTIKKSIKDKGLENVVFMVGRADLDMLRILYNAADILIMPNIPVSGDMEGFGLVSVEAASCSLPVIASNLEGIKDAIKDGENGFLIKPYDVEGYVRKIEELIENDEQRMAFGNKARKFTIDKFSWDYIAQNYYSQLCKLKETI